MSINPSAVDVALPTHSALADGGRRRFPTVLRILTLTFALTLTLLVRADEVDDFQRDTELALDAVGAASEEVLGAGLDGSPDHLLAALVKTSESLVLQSNLLTAAQSDPVKSALGNGARATKMALVAFTTATTKAATPLSAAQSAGDISNKTLKSLLSKLKAANMSGLAVAARLKKLPRAGFTLTETGESAGFHKPGSVANFKLVQNPFGPACAGPFTVTVTDQFGAPVTTDPHTFQVADPKGRFSIVLGTAGGSARVRIEGCGMSSERLLFNYGAFGKINKVFQLLPTILPHGSVSDFGLPYLSYVDAEGGTDPCVWTSENMPNGYTLQTVNAGHGITAATVGISGFPFATPNTVGTFTVTIIGTDALGHIARRAYSLTIDP